jgi:hypothetical protein
MIKINYSKAIRGCMKAQKHDARLLSDISDILSGGEIVAFNSLDSRNIIFLIAKKKLNYREEQPGGSLAKIKTTTGQDYSVFITSDDEVINIVNIQNEPYNIHDVQALSNDRVLLVCGRSRRRLETDYDLNGRIYSTDGALENKILLGDGIQNTQVASDGKIWTSYFDEGVFGNYGWNSPVGQSGLIAWKSTGEKVYEYSPAMGLDVICDCYALNVESSSTTWCYYYTEFPLVKIKDGKILDYWNIPVRGSDAFAIFRNYALFRGGYDDKDNLYFIELLNNHVAKVHTTVTLSNTSQIDWVTARGDSMFFLSNGLIYTVNVHEFLPQHGYP